MIDVLIIGSGPGGYVAAIRAAQLGLNVSLVEKDALGGICLNWGCIPTKALLKAAEVYKTIKKASAFGINVEGDVSFDFSKVIERSRASSAQLSKGVEMLLKKNKINTIFGHATLKSRNQDGSFLVEIKGEKEQNVLAKNVIIATGARARQLKGFEADGDLVWSYREALVPKEFPKKLGVVGSGAIGSEFASFYSSMGCDVTLLEAQKRILPNEDEEISKIARKSFENSGITIKTGITLNSLEKVSGGVKLSYDNKTEEFDKVIMAVGVVANVENIGLENLGVDFDSFIKTDKYLKTSLDGLYAIGDVTKGPWLAHKASHEGIIAVEYIASKLGKYDAKKVHAIDSSQIPGCTYTMPQIASFGITEAQAKDSKTDVKIGRFSPAGNGKAITSGSTEGLVKTIFDAKTGEILGVHMIGDGVTEMIASLLVAKKGELVEEDLMSTIFPHPTMSEMIHESVLDAYGKCIHM